MYETTKVFAELPTAPIAPLHEGIMHFFDFKQTDVGCRMPSGKGCLYLPLPI